MYLCLMISINHCMHTISSPQPGGDAKELYAVHGEGETARTVRLLKTPEIYDGVAPDNFTDQRPIIAVVKKGR